MNCPVDHEFHDHAHIVVITVRGSRTEWSGWLPDEKDPKSRYAKPGVASLPLVMGKAESRVSPVSQSVVSEGRPEIGGIFDALSLK